MIVKSVEVLVYYSKFINGENCIAIPKGKTIIFDSYNYAV